MSGLPNGVMHSEETFNDIYHDDLNILSEDSFDDNLHIEHVYVGFICPLSKKVMKDPVVLENGKTFERSEIDKWLSECRNNNRKITCPVTEKELRSMVLTPNSFVREIIEEWSRRNEAARINLARLTLSPARSEADTLKALDFIQEVCLRNKHNKKFLRKANFIPGIIGSLENKSINIRCKALETLRVITMDDAKNKEAVAEGDTIRTIIKFLNHKSTEERVEAISLLYEFSKLESLSEKIGDVNGAMLMLLGMQSDKSEDPCIADKTNKTLENLEKIGKNVLHMAENGKLQPLLKRLTDGEPETQLAMASYLGELALGNDQKVLVAKTAASALLTLMRNKDNEEKATALKALNQISTHHSSADILIEEGILPPLVNDVLASDNKDIPMVLKEISATLLTNIVFHGSNFAFVKVDKDSRTLVSEETIHKLLHLISNTGTAIICKLLEVLIGLTSTPKPAQSVVVAIKSSGATINLIQFIDAPQVDIRAASIKLLHNISPYMGPELVDLLSESASYIPKLMEIISQGNVITEEQAAAVGIFAELPDKEPKLIKCLMRYNVFTVVLSQILKIRRGEILGGHRVTPHLETLVRVLLKLVYNLETTTETLVFARENNITMLFIGLLQTNGADNIQIVSAKALENLSTRSKRFVRARNPSKCMASPFSKKKPVSTFECSVHRGFCSTKENFCLVEGDAIVKLVSCMDHPNEKVVEAALAALCTLLEDGVDFEKGIYTIRNADGIRLILKALQDNKTEYLRYKAVFAVEKMLRIEFLAKEISTDQSIDQALKEAYKHGENRTKKIAERALEHINKLPVFPASKK